MTDPGIADGFEQFAGQLLSRGRVLRESLFASIRREERSAVTTAPAAASRSAASTKAQGVHIVPIYPM